MKIRQIYGEALTMGLRCAKDSLAVRPSVLFNGRMISSVQLFPGGGQKGMSFPFHSGSLPSIHQTFVRVSHEFGKMVLKKRKTGEKRVAVTFTVAASQGLRLQEEVFAMSKVIGIDVSTTNSCVAVMEGGEPIMIANAQGNCSKL